MKRKIKYSPKDFTYADLPISRKQQFFDILKTRWRTLLFLAVILFISSLPLFVLILVKDGMATSISNNSSLADEEKIAQLFINQMFFGIFYVPATSFIFVALSGILRIYRQLIWGEGIMLKDDFLLGIKRNWLFYFLISIFFSIIYFISTLAAFYISIPWLSYLPMAIYFVVIIPIFAISLCYSQVYNNSFFKQLKNSSLLLFMKAPKYYLFYLLVIFPCPIMLLSALPYMAKYLIFFFSMIVIFPLTLLIWFLFNHQVYDEKINKNMHPELYHRGLNDICRDENVK